MKIVRISKRYTRKISHDYKSWEFSTELTADVEIENDEDLEQQSDLLFKKAMKCVINDMKTVASTLVKEDQQPNEL